jgi:hypothetical protein
MAHGYYHLFVHHLLLLIMHPHLLHGRSLLVACSQPHKTQNEDKFLIFEASKKVLHLNYLRHFSSSLTGCWASRRAADESCLLGCPVLSYWLASCCLFSFATHEIIQTSTLEKASVLQLQYYNAIVIIADVYALKQNSRHQIECKPILLTTMLRKTELPRHFLFHWLTTNLC